MANLRWGYHDVACALTSIPTSCVIEAGETPSLQSFEARALFNPTLIVVFLKATWEKRWLSAPYLDPIIVNTENSILMISYFLPKSPQLQNGASKLSHSTIFLTESGEDRTSSMKKIAMYVYLLVLIRISLRDMVKPQHFSRMKISMFCSMFIRWIFSRGNIFAYVVSPVCSLIFIHIQKLCFFPSLWGR
jgi:hypothetical protein